MSVIKGLSIQSIHLIVEQYEGQEMGGGGYSKKEICY